MSRRTLLLPFLVSVFASLFSLGSVLVACDSSDAAAPGSESPPSTQRDDATTRADAPVSPTDAGTTSDANVEDTGHGDLPEARPSETCQGTCEGNCAGRCTATDGPVVCYGRCEGDCSASPDTGGGLQANGTCKGLCDGTCVYHDGGARTCEGICTGTCDAECK
ncbi:hypothetical protein AKJ09_10651 [Labilithrix luteola]|uniref:Tryptophan synthase alpha chain n=1 Tax=Labilithrix luteola TaxID=1391654 RepID=A0A0K1QE40_9BACT|nr:hypothetical protein [Labilithrix luteola]AKV03988.1 hypothetical protein AKJ09_10651 [Labilithrix luteola]